MVFAEIDAEQRRKEVNTEGEKYGKGPIEGDDDEDSTPGSGTAKRTISTTEPECGMIGKGDHER